MTHRRDSGVPNPGVSASVADHVFGVAKSRGVSDAGHQRDGVRIVISRRTLGSPGAPRARSGREGDLPAIEPSASVINRRPA